MRFLPALDVGLLLRVPVDAVAQDVQELHGGLLQHRVPGAARRLARPVYRRGPAPAVVESVASAAAILSSISFAAFPFRRFARVRE